MRWPGSAILVFAPMPWFLPDDHLLGFVEIPAGEFLMGSNKKKDAQAYDDELKQHKLTLPRYYIARFPVTVAQFQRFVDESRYQPEHPECLQGLSNHPVVNVTWYEALKYCEWLTDRLRNWESTPEPLTSLLKKQGWRITLPSEAEWEKAARGADGRIYPWGNKADATLANYSQTGIGASSAVGCFPGGASPYGCEEMSGNVWEWTRSLWGKDVSEPKFKYPYDPNDGREKFDEPDEVRRVLRGGAFLSDDRHVRCAYRSRFFQSSRNDFIGFRLVVRTFFSRQNCRTPHSPGFPVETKNGGAGSGPRSRLQRDRANNNRPAPCPDKIGIGAGHACSISALRRLIMYSRSPRPLWAAICAHRPPHKGAGLRLD